MADVVKGSRDWIWQLVLALPALWCLIMVPPLWRDTDGFNQIASTFAPKGIIHWLPGYCFFGRLVMIAAGILASVVSGHGLPYLSIGTPQLSDAGIYALLLLQHVLLFAAMTYLVRTLVRPFWWCLACSIVLALTPWMYTFANCIGSEAFSNPLVLLVVAYGWRCLEAPSLTPRKLGGLFGLLLAASLCRQVNPLLAAILPLTCLFLALRWLVPVPALASGVEAEPNGIPIARTHKTSDAGHWLRRCALFAALGAMAALGSIGIQRVMCVLFRVPYRSTFGETFEWRLNFLKRMPAAERSRLLARVATSLHDPVITCALADLDASVDRGAPWDDMFLYYAMDAELERAGLTQLQPRTYQIDLKLNQVARQFILSANPYLLGAIREDFLAVPAFTQAQMAVSPFETTDWLRAQLAEPRYGRLRPLVSFQHPPGFFGDYANRVPYLHILSGVPMAGWAVIAVTGALIAWCRRDPKAAVAAAYAVGLVITGFLIALATCASTFLGARLHLPVYSLFQIAALLVVARGLSPAS